MAKKKKSQKKKFRQTVSAPVSKSTRPAEAIKPAKDKSSAGTTTSNTDQSKKPSSKPIKKSTSPDYSEFSYVAKETKHTLVIIGGIVVVYLVLWYLFTHTGIGPAIYRLIKM